MNSSPFHFPAVLADLLQHIVTHRERVLQEAVADRVRELLIFADQFVEVGEKTLGERDPECDQVAVLQTEDVHRTRHKLAEERQRAHHGAGGRLVLFDGETDPKLAGTYPARLKVRNSAGGTAEIPVTYEIYNAAEYDRLPGLNLDTYLLYLKKGEKFNAADHLKSAVIDGKEYSFVRENGSYGAAGETEDAAKNTAQYTIDQSLVTVTGEVDTNTAGCYEVNYSLSDSAFGTGTGTARLYVVITEGGAE